MDEEEKERRSGEEGGVRRGRGGASDVKKGERGRQGEPAFQGLPPSVPPASRPSVYAHAFTAAQLWCMHRGSPYDALALVRRSQAPHLYSRSRYCGLHSPASLSKSGGI